MLAIVIVNGAAAADEPRRVVEQLQSRQSPENATTRPIQGPLRIRPANRRYFADGNGRAVYLTGSHTWGNLCDYPPEKYPPFDYRAYLDFLGRYHHNFFRLWPGDLSSNPSPYERSGPGQASDGKPRVDLSRLNPEYFDRLRARVIAARDRGIYVDVVLFRPDASRPKYWMTHLFNPDNNVQGINSDTNGDGLGAEAFDLSIPEITRIQEDYVCKAIDSVDDLDNVLFEIGNEGDVSSINWQYHFIRFIRQYEAKKPRQHPVGMTAVFDWVGGTSETDNESLWKSGADWISPGLAPYQHDPPASDGSKVIIADVDHIWPAAPQDAWIWKCFLRGIQPIHMDAYTYGDPSGGFNLHGITKEAQEAMRHAMGQTLRLAERVNLAAMTPRADLASTGYCLANEGEDYIIFAPKQEDILARGLKRRRKYHGEWIVPAQQAGEPNRNLTSDDGTIRLWPPSSGAVLFLSAAVAGD